MLIEGLVVELDLEGVVDRAQRCCGVDFVRIQECQLVIAVRVHVIGEGEVLAYLGAVVAVPGERGRCTVDVGLIGLHGSMTLGAEHIFAGARRRRW